MRFISERVIAALVGSLLGGLAVCQAQIPSERSSASWMSAYEKMASQVKSKSVNYPDEGLEEYGNTTFSLLYRNEAFLNSSFRSHVSDGYLKQLGGIDIGYASMLVRPLELEVSAFYNVYDTTGDEPADDYMTTHYGVEAFLNVYVLPYVGRISEWVFPYVGIGYQTSRLSNSGGGEEGDAMSLGTGGLIAKGGIKIRVASNTCIQASYKQILPPGKENLFRAVEIGVCFNH